MTYYELKYRKLKRRFRLYLFFTLILFILFGTYFYMNYNYFAFKHLISGNYIYTETLDQLYEEELGVKVDKQYYKYFDYLVAEVLTDRIYEVNQDKYTYLYTPKAYANRKQQTKEEAAESEFYKLDDNTVYLRITNFSKGTKDLLEDNKEELKSYPRLVLDLRDNLGGDISALYKMLDLYLPKGKVLSEDVLRSKLFSRTVKTKNDAFFDYNHIYILQNNWTASSAENMIVALKDNLDQVTLIGEKTFGKGIGQTTIPLTNGYAIKATTMKWLRPNGESIHQNGITPDLPYDSSDEGIIAYAVSQKDD